MAAMPDAMSKESFFRQVRAKLKRDLRVLMANQILFNDVKAAHTLGRL